MIERMLWILGALLGSYVLGSVPSGYWIGKLRGVDIRSQGSGNMGATNAFRVLGPAAGYLVFLIDAGKGFSAVFLLARLTAYPGSDWIRVGCALAAILGHTYTVFLNFKGGKGVATAFGVFLALAPVSTVLAFLGFLIVVAFSRYISAGSVIAALGFPFLVWVVGESGQSFLILSLALLTSVLILLRHTQNIRRLFHGTENRLGQKPSVAESSVPDPARDGREKKA